VYLEPKLKISGIMLTLVDWILLRTLCGNLLRTYTQEEG